MKHEYDAASRKHTWQFTGSVKPVTFTVPMFGPGKLEDETGAEPTMDAAMVLGYKQKIANGAAIPHNTETGKAAMDAEKREGMQAIVERLEAGQWNAVAAGGKAKTVDVTTLVAVIAAKLGKPSAGVRAYVEAKDEAGRRALADSAEFAESYVLQVAKSRPLVALSAEIDAELDAIE